MNWLDNWITQQYAARRSQYVAAGFPVALRRRAGRWRDDSVVAGRARARGRPGARAATAARPAIHAAANTGATARSTDSCAAAAADPPTVARPAPSRRPSRGSARAAIPVDGKDYIISYNDCCGKTACGHCNANATKAIGRCINRRRATTSTGVMARRRTCTTVRRRWCWD